MVMAREKESEKGKISRREFVVAGGTVIAGGAVAACTLSDASASQASDEFPLSTAYLVYDSRYCAGCQSCMLACSLVHEGAACTSLSRIQIARAVLTKYPDDIQIHVCRQCPDPLCVRNCPTGACHVNTANGNVRMIDSEKCIGCRQCISSCHFTPHRTIWNQAAQKATKCDLCVDAPYFSKKGGPAGQQACVTTCPVGALKVVTELPSQLDNSGYDLRFAPEPQRGQATTSSKTGEE